MAMESRNREFWNFSDQLRLDGLSIGDSIWSPAAAPAAGGAGGADLNSIAWKGGGGFGAGAGQKLAFTSASSFDRNNNNMNSVKSGGIGGGGGYFNNNFNNGEIKSYFNKAVGKMGGEDLRRKNVNLNEGKGMGMGKKKSVGNNDNAAAAVDKRFKTLPPSEALPRSEAVGGYIFVCNNDTMHENLKRQLFGLPPRYRDSVRAITPGLPLFLYNYSTHQLHGIFEAASFGGTNIDPLAWEDKKCPGESRFPAQILLN